MGKQMSVEFCSCSFYDVDGTEEELQCPECGCPALSMPDEVDDAMEKEDYYGFKATCSECGNVFVVTGKCFVVIPDDSE
jgi:uncharacterized Zn finger protein